MTNQPRPEPRKQGAPNPFVDRRSWPALIGAAVVLLAIIATPAVILLSRSMNAPELMGTLPAWTLTDHDGDPIGSKQLAGHPYVVSFFFTSCPSICPKIMNAMRTVQGRHDSVRLISISVDPLTDTPQRLRESIGRYGVDTKRWRLVTGTDEAVRKVVVEGFKTFVGKKVAKDADVFDIAHGARLVLVDGGGGVRGHFETTEAGLQALVQAVEAID